MTDSHQDQVLVKLDHAKRALAEAKTLQQAKQILAVASAAEIYAKRQHGSEEAISYAYAVKIEALRRLGALIREGQDNGELAGQGRPEKPSNGEGLIPTKLGDLNITYKTSMIAQRLADLPQAIFEQVREGTVSITKALRDAQGTHANTVAWSLESVEQDLRKAINDTLVGAPPDSHQQIAELLRRLADELEQAADLELRESVAIARDELDLRDAEPGGYRIFESEADASTHPGAPAVIGSCKSTHQPWYRNLTTRKPGITALRRKQVEARLDDIEVGKLLTKRTANTHIAVAIAIKDLARTSPLRGRP